MSFADPLKRILWQMTDCPSSLLWGPSKMREIPIDGWGDLTVRNGLKTLGDALVACHPDMLIRKLEEAMNDVFNGTGKWYYSPLFGITGDLVRPHDYQGIIIPDCRQIREMQWVLGKGGTLVRLKGRPASDDTHRTEVEQLAMPDSEFHYVIDNSKLTLDQLYSLVDSIAEAKRNGSH